MPERAIRNAEPTTEMKRFYEDLVEKPMRQESQQTETRLRNEKENGSMKWDATQSKTSKSKEVNARDRTTEKKIKERKALSKTGQKKSSRKRLRSR